MTVFVDVVGRGPNLTMLHGWGLNGAVWNGVRDALSERYTLHIIDLPGHGYSQGAAISTLGAMADAVANAMPKRSHLLGWSMGGLVALELARRHHARIDRLALVAATPSFLQRDGWAHAVLPAVLSDFAARLSRDAAATIKSFLALQVLYQPNMRDTMAALQQAVSARGSPDSAAFAAGLEILRSTDLRSQLPNIVQPSLVMQGDRDALTPEPAGRWLAAALPDARYVMVAKAAHAPFLSHRDRFMTELGSFLAA
jgi:pimeloyl-[acyl-carrier protein] methyl ester esterase